jgi:hypothetical protein
MDMSKRIVAARTKVKTAALMIRVGMLKWLLAIVCARRSPLIASLLITLAGQDRAACPLSKGIRTDLGTLQGRASMLTDACFYVNRRLLSYLFTELHDLRVAQRVADHYYRRLERNEAIWNSNAPSAAAPPGDVPDHDALEEQDMAQALRESLLS